MEEVLERHILESFREKYHRAGKLAKGELLKEVQDLLGCHRKHAIRAMRRRPHGIVVSVYVVGDHPSELKPRVDRLADDQLPLESVEEALH